MCFRFRHGHHFHYCRGSRPDPRFQITNCRFKTWRRGWDSNPRNGSPFTAFPVLPIQPLLHLSNISDFRLPIADWSDRTRERFLQTSQSAIINWQLAMSWRRGWDSNPRWALTHSGFRDRCTNPLCDLSESRCQISEIRCQQLPESPRLLERLLLRN